MAVSAVAEAMADRPVPLRERIAPWGHAPLRGSRPLVPSTLRSAATPVLRSGSATEDGEDGRARAFDVSPKLRMNLFELLPGDAQKNTRAEEVFRGREPLDDRTLWERFFSQYGVTEDTVMRVRKVLTTVLQTDLSRIRDTDDFSKELAFFWDWDSMADVEAVQGLEVEFGITISDADAEAMKTLKDIVTGVHEKIKNRG